MGCQHTVLLLGSDAIGWGELRQVLADLPDVRVVGDTADPAAARRLAAAHIPDAIIAAATLDGHPILPLLAELRRTCCPATKAILVAADYAPGRLRSPAVLRHCLAAAIAGDVILGSGAVVRRFVAGLRGEGPDRLAASGVTTRERAILGGLAAGRSYDAIAQAEGIGARTVERVVADLERRLDAPNLFALGLRAAQLGLVR